MSIDYQPMSPREEIAWAELDCRLNGDKADPLSLKVVPVRPAATSNPSTYAPPTSPPPVVR